VRLGAQTLFNGLGRWTVDILGKSTAEMTVCIRVLLQIKPKIHATSAIRKQVGGWIGIIDKIRTYSALKRCDVTLSLTYDSVVPANPIN
jgi:hypothetical protein